MRLWGENRRKKIDKEFGKVNKDSVTNTGLDQRLSQVLQTQ